ncbi:MAG: alpha/beta hydrolase [Bacteroidetes bacterium 4572_77]|nr:MAG: alpha/beta hydrolase [Bacteroidetes bacterium 4572_77]
MKYILKSLFLIIVLHMTSCAPYKSIPEINSFQDIKYQREVKKVALSNDIQIAYTEMGEGKETIIFIHGLGSYLPAWDKIMPELSKKYHCIAIDLPGYGKSSKDPHSGLMTFYADVIDEFADSLNIDKFNLAGHSMGGQIAIVYGLSWPERINNLILFAPAGFERFTSGQKRWLENVMTPNLVHHSTYEAIETNLAYNFYKMPKDAEFMITDRLAMRKTKDFNAYCYAVSKSVAGMVNEPVIDKLEDLQPKTLIFFGENDNLIPNRFLNPGSTAKIAKQGSDLIPNSKLIMIPKCGHFVMFEKPKTIPQEIIKFIN